MAEQFELSKLYDNIRKNIPPPDSTKKQQPTQPKRIQTLSECYKSMSLPIEEDYSIYGGEEGGDGGEPELLGIIDNEEYRLLKREIKAKQAGGVYEKIHMLLALAGWTESPKKDREGTDIPWSPETAKTAKKFKEYNLQLYSPVWDSLRSSHIDLESLELLINIKQHNPERLAVIDENLKSPEVFDISKIVVNNLAKLLRGEERNNIQDLFNALYEINLTMGQVGVGKGEVCLTLLTNAVKGKIGDLNISNVGEVEVKGSGGRPGSDKHAVGKHRELYRKLLSRQYDVEQIRKASGIPELKKKYESSQETFQKAIETLRTNINAHQNKDELYKSLEAISGIINTNIIEPKTLLNANIDEVEPQVEDFMENNNISGTIHPFTSLSRKIKGTADLQNGIRGLVRNRIELDKGINELRLTKGPAAAGDVADVPSFKASQIPSWDVVVQNFFTNDYRLELNEIVEGFLQIRNHELPPELQERLKAELTEFLNPETPGSRENRIDKLKETNQKFLNDMITTLHIYCYFSDTIPNGNLKHAFNYLLLINDISKNAYSINPGNRNQLYNHIYNQVAAVNTKIGKSMGDRGVGVQVTLNH